MHIVKPDYFDSFECIADRCKDTCCAGWQIVVDEASLAKYKKEKSDYLYTLMACVDWESGTFRQDKSKRCAFLNEQNLCEMYKNIGKDSLCKTCREYPRHTEEFEDVREISLSISCPEVARVLMQRESPVTFIHKDDFAWEETEDFEDFDPFFYSILEGARDEMLKILQNRELSLAERAMLVLGMAHDIQGRINRERMFECDDVIQKYIGKKALEYIRNYLKGCSMSVSSTASAKRSAEAELSLEMFQKLYTLEMLREDWDDVLRESRAILFFATKEGFDENKRSFELWKKEHPKIQIQLEQLLVYFVFIYFPGSVYDGAVFAKVQMAVYCTWMIELLWMARWLLNGKQITIEEMIEIVYRFSREVEHSDENLNHLDKIMGKKWLL